MNKQRVRKALTAVTIAGLAAGLVLMAAGCKSSQSSCNNGSCSGAKKTDTTPKSSCAGGSCTGTQK